MRHGLLEQWRPLCSQTCLYVVGPWPALSTVRSFHTSERKELRFVESSTPQRIAIVGGGITGLSAAYFLSNALPRAKIVLYEASPRFGGWINSSRVPVNGGHVVFERGPHTLRPSSGPRDDLVLQLIAKLGLIDKVIATPKDSPAAKNRYIYYPDRLVNVQSLQNVFTEPLFKGTLASILAEPFRRRKASPLDESVGSFLRRRMSPSFVDNIASAGLHGIYAGNVDHLSAKAIMPKLKWLEEKYGSFCAGALALAWGRYVKRTEIMRPFDHALRTELANTAIQLDPQDVERLAEFKRASVITFKDGQETLPRKMVQILKKSSNVELLTKSSVWCIDNSRDSIKPSLTPEQIAVSIKFDGRDQRATAYFDHVISTIPSGHLVNTFIDDPIFPSLSDLWWNTVMSVSLFYSSPNLVPVRGFGYLIPRSIQLQYNPNCALGVLFDSETTPGQDSVPGTKLTVMLGGHWWRGRSSFPSEEEGVRMAKSVLRQHLNICAEPSAALVSLQRSCIPSYEPNHLGRMVQAHRALVEQYHGRVRVAGNSYAGVGVNDCIRSAYETARDLVSGQGKTGLESFLPENDYRAYPIEPS